MKTSWKELWHNHQVKIRFFFIGVWNTVFSYLVYITLDSLFTYVFTKRYMAYMTAAVIANVIGTTSAFLFHKYITFKSPVRGKGVIIEYIKFYSTYTVTTLLSFALLPFFVEVLKIDPKLSGALLIPVIAVFSYFGHSRFTFKNK